MTKEQIIYLWAIVGSMTACLATILLITYTMGLSPAKVAWHTWHHDIRGRTIYCSPWHTCPSITKADDYFGEYYHSEQWVDDQWRACKASPAHCRKTLGIELDTNKGGTQ